MHYVAPISLSMRKGLTIADITKKFYAIVDRYKLINALISMGTLNGKIVTCSFNYVQFAFRREQNLKDPASEGFRDIGKLREKTQKLLVYAKKLRSSKNIVMQKIVFVRRSNATDKINPA